MLDSNLFLSKEMMIVPEHPLAHNLEIPISTTEQVSIAQIRAKQQRDRIPGIVKRIIPIDNDTFWEYWWNIPGRLLLPEDVELLQRDRPRVDAILSKLLWLWGGCCLGEATNCNLEHELVYDWQQVIAFANQKGFKPDLLDIDYLPMTVKQNHQNSDSMLDISSATNYVAVEPAHWHIEFFQLQPIAGGFELQEPKQVCNCQIWTAKPFLKHLETGETITKYDLCVSRPLDLTNPPWRSPLASEQG